MNGENEPEAVVTRLWQEHLQAPFPAGLAGAERAAIDLVLLDADISGCVSTWRNNNGHLDVERRRILHTCITDMEQVLPLLSATDNPPYWQRLHLLARLVSEAHARPPKCN
ncbi:hypothetical protein ABZS61_08660 [Streptomyces sp. NPDC005566]|uniref:hypothetical protein n=1 Tax=Streptomyces sp. NPDC005566 TaxID=3156886 RepID=UPI0033A700A4